MHGHGPGDRPILESAVSDEIRCISEMQEGDPLWTGVLGDLCAQAAIWCTSHMTTTMYRDSRMDQVTRCVSRM